MIRIGLTTVGLLLFVVAMACTKEVEVEVIKEVPVEVIIYPIYPIVYDIVLLGSVR